ncbi:pyruvate kinase [Pseudodesulfovibrio piezophilus]|uniref:Pyruvate kinase n=1 Tax=Pseudodesulfovibrio piezophilus (strain DSM 21447 / JCM 15486 / C1TLV30) TaxID=1322246 RepID=M1WM16_PSEP2|nr:pyruvate kinase [Pseudodesulfovibrio piezophilus]CCH48825.1 Pyruvate kinase 1 [Pseudodesulfovibrio piezophilus C1TLV30]
MDRHIKIIATLGPGTESYEAVRELVESGAKIFRLNFSHGGREFFEKMVSIIRRLEEETGLTLTVLQDLSGPKIRTCDVGLGAIEVNKGTEVLLGTTEQYKDDGEPFICLDIPELFESLKEGDPVALGDGVIRFKVVKVEEKHLIRLVATNSGICPPRKGITFPGMKTPLAPLTEKDKADLAIGMELGVDVVAMSFVQKGEDIGSLRAEMVQYGKQLPIIAKLERTAALECLDEILEEADGIMVARGDLGLELDLAELPAAQKRIIRACNALGKPVIVATQMLLSMVNSPMATRAETTDVANAILDGADCVMLSEETAVGQYPFEAVRFMRKIAYEIERYMFEANVGNVAVEGVREHPSTFLAHAAAMLAAKTDAKAIVCHSTSGATTRILSSCRPTQSIYALSSDSTVRHFTNLSLGVIPAVPLDVIDDHQERAEIFVRQSPDFVEGDIVILTAGQPEKGKTVTQTNVVKLYEKLAKEVS